MHSVLPQRVYRIQDDHHYFLTGQSENGIQTLMGIQLPELVCLEFDKDGNYVRTGIKEIAWYKQASFEYDAEKLSSELRAWQTELGIMPCTILVKPFFLPDRWIGIRDLPEYCQQALDHPEDYEAERLQEIQEDIRQWQESGDYVLVWNEDYFMSEEGEVVGS